MGKQKSATTKKTQNPVFAAKNRKLKQERHEKRLLMFNERADETDKLLVLAQNLLHINTKAGIKRLVGTLNFNRLTDIKNNTYLRSGWFIKRELKLQEKKYVRKSILQKTPTKNETITQ